MVFTFRKTLHPLLLMWFIVGLGIYPVKELKQKNRWIVYLSILYSVIVWFAYGYFFYYVTNIFTLTRMFGSISNIVVTLINILTTIMSVIVTLYHQKVQVL